MAQDPALQARFAQVLAPGYALEAEIGRGGMGIVYRAKDTRLKRSVAVKLLPPELAYRDEIRSRFLREAEMAAQLSHPNIVPIYSVDEKDGFVYFIMAFVDGETLAQRLTTHGRLGIVEVRALLRQVADALAYAHQRGVIHRDIKPDNIMLQRDDGRAMVTDFGIARAADDTTGTRLTATGVAIGTPAYMSPEQCTGERAVDGRSDLYSLGVVIYAALVGTPPFAGSNTAALLVKHLTETPRPIKEVRQDVPDDLVAIINRLLQKNPADRFQDAASVVKALDFPDSIPKVAPAPTPAPAPAPVYAPPPAYAPAPSPALVNTGRSKPEKLADRTDAEGLALRVRKFRRATVSFLGWNALWFGINAMSGLHDIWFFWITIWPGFAIVNSAGKLWADGVNPWAALMGNPVTVGRGALASGERSASRLVAPEVLNGPYGAVVRRATGDHAAVLDHYAKLKAAAKKSGAPVTQDPTPAANELVDQIADYATALHRIDVETPESLRPQLSARRVELTAQLERASLVLQNLALDLLRLRSLGVDTVTSATEQGRALSDNIGYALAAAEELRSNK
ncbi:MAG TPA: serine/threonine-protein kinase [Gemmatimonadaceae bacterium]|jgi:serine/threonine protein kinase|nr:serine/threonine-protein kinase [Gemmatimonadaceae bacterium]